MRLLTEWERQVLIELSEQFPTLRDEMQRKLDADIRLYWETVILVRLRQLEARQGEKRSRHDFRRKLVMMVGSTLAMVGVTL